MSSMVWLDEDPKLVAARLVDASRDRPAWLAAFAGELETRALADQLPRVLGAWSLSAADGGPHVRGVPPGAVQVVEARVPADRLEAVADLAAATDLLVHYLKRDRIPAVVRRSAPRMGGRSLMDLAAAGDTRGVLGVCRAMFTSPGSPPETVAQRHPGRRAPLAAGPPPGPTRSTRASPRLGVAAGTRREASRSCTSTRIWSPPAPTGNSWSPAGATSPKICATTPRRCSSPPSCPGASGWPTSTPGKEWRPPVCPATRSTPTAR